MAETLGLNEGIHIAGAMGDGTIPGVYFCLDNPKTLALTYGTSIAMSFLSEDLHEISGLNGVVKDGVIEGYYGYDAGQPCAGDMLNWFVNSVNDDHVNLTELAQQSNP